jgi:hypothetical protein
MQNAYKGPPSDFAMVVPVPVVLKKNQVKTLPHDVFDRVDKLAAPRLVEYWEEDPCAPPLPPPVPSAVTGAGPGGGGTRSSFGMGVKIEAKFEVGEYQIVILSAKDSSGLDAWLRQQKYNIPDGAEPYLRPYVESGSKFFVAKVDASKVKFEGGQAMLSPLRFHYDSKEFSLPVRLGLMNSEGTQDLIVHILAPGQRYEVANYPNVTVPTNIDVADETRQRFGEFYAALFDATLEKNPKAVVTEYAWDSGSCDPCPTPPLSRSDLTLLGDDVLSATAGRIRGYVLTRLHARYDRDALGEDLVFKAAEPIVGGREFRAGGGLEEGAKPSGINNFQGRYAIRHPWEGAIECESPRRGNWGGPPDGQKKQIAAATGTAFAPRGNLGLANVIRSGVPALGIAGKPAGSAAAVEPVSAPEDHVAVDKEDIEAARKRTKQKECGCQSSGEGALGGALVLLLLVASRPRGRWRGRRC